MFDLDTDLNDLANRLEGTASTLFLLSRHENWDVACEIAADGSDPVHPAARLGELLDSTHPVVPHAWLDEVETAAQDLEAWLDDPEGGTEGSDWTTSAAGFDLLHGEDEDGVEGPVDEDAGDP